MTFYVTVAGSGVAPIVVDAGTNAPPSNVYGRVLAGGVVSGIKDGVGAGAGISANDFNGIAAFSNGSLVIGDSNVLRRFSPADGALKTIGNTSGGTTPTDGGGASAQFPGSIDSIVAVDDSTILFTSGNQVWAGFGPFSHPNVLTAGSFSFVRIAGDVNNGAGTAVGDGNAVRFQNTSALAYDPIANTIYVCDQQNHRIVRGTLVGSSIASPSSWNFVSFAGTGVSGFADGATGTAQFALPDGLALGDDNALYVADSSNARLRRISLLNNTVSTVAGDGTSAFVDGTPGQVRIPRGLASDGAGSIYFYDFFRLRVYRNGRLYTIATDAPGSVSDGYLDGAGQHPPSRLAVNPKSGTLYSVTVSSITVPRLVAYEAVVP